MIVQHAAQAAVLTNFTQLQLAISRQRGYLWARIRTNHQSSMSITFNKMSVGGTVVRLIYAEGVLGGVGGRNIRFLMVFCS